jgi:hypothetical protein
MSHGYFIRYTWIPVRLFQLLNLMCPSHSWSSNMSFTCRWFCQAFFFLDILLSCSPCRCCNRENYVIMDICIYAKVFVSMSLCCVDGVWKYSTTPEITSCLLCDVVWWFIHCNPYFPFTCGCCHRRFRWWFCSSLSFRNSSACSTRVIKSRNI